jgi:hypothetical protein
MAPMTTKRKTSPRQKWASSAARQAHSNQRRKLARDAAQRQADEMSKARRDIDGAAQRKFLQEMTRRQSMIPGGLGDRLHAVMNSWGLTLPVSIAPSSYPGGWTDFKSITVKHRSKVPDFTPGQEETTFVPDAFLRQVATETRAIFYHEVGHNLFTVPLSDLIALAVEDGDIVFPNEHVLGDGWTFRGATSFGPLGDPLPAIGRRKTSTLTPTTGPAGQAVLAVEENDVVLYLPSSTFQHFWNVLEDQRMECALVEESPNIAAYLTVLVDTVILPKVDVFGEPTEPKSIGATSWALVAGRTYLPPAMRRASKAAWNHQTGAAADDVAAIVAAYCSATTPGDMVAAVLDLQALLVTPYGAPGVDDHSRINQGAPSPDARERIGKTAKGEQDEEPSEATSGASKGSSEKPGEESEDEQDGSGADDSSDDSKKDWTGDHRATSPGSESPSEGEYQDILDADARPEVDADLEDAREKLQEILDQDDAITSDVAAMNEAYSTHDGSLRQITLPPTNNSEMAATASSLAWEVESSFRTASADAAPHWESQQRRGFLEPIRYRTRQPGDTEIFRNYVDGGEPGTDLAVSLFLDISGSMQGTEDELGVVAWSVKTACDNLGIECDVNLFNSSGVSVWGSQDRASESVPRIETCGGTNPSQAFLGALTRERDASSHFIIVMTDGSWDIDAGSGLPDLRKDNWSSLLLYFSAGESGGLTPLPSLAARCGTDEAYSTGDLMNIPRIVEQCLVDAAVR